MQCPKEKHVELIDSTLAGHLAVKHCPTCDGSWIPAENYHDWKEQQPATDRKPLPPPLNMDYGRSPLDTRGALCPECNCYLARAKVGSKNPFYIERCVNCGGIWCDRGEWDVLETLGLHAHIEILFSNEWQFRVKEAEQAERERRATVEKLGDELANRVFELAELLENHPNGDFGVAYLMRRFDK
ncbi:MAG TPA: zf-TFIIB domain-containing protein [Crinalium sp.]